MVEAKINLQRLANRFNVSALRENTTIVSNNGGLEENKIMDMICYFTPWEQVRGRQEMNIRICSIEYKDKVQYTPGEMDGQTFRFTEEKISGEMVIVINDIVSINNIIKRWMDDVLPTYMFATVHKWVPLESGKIDC